LAFLAQLENDWFENISKYKIKCKIHQTYKVIQQGVWKINLENALENKRIYCFIIKKML